MGSHCNFRILFVLFIVLCELMQALSGGLLLLYRPNDVTEDCVHSLYLRYDLSFGMGMSDTITLEFRTIADMDYECEVDVVTDVSQTLFAVIRYPTFIGHSCDRNPRAFYVMRVNDSFPVCHMLSRTDLFSKFWIMIKKGRFRFLFRSNSSINTDMEAHIYEVTVTTARPLRKNEKCSNSNETNCYDFRFDRNYCMTNGIVCDGINNCGVENWFDERQSECQVPIQHLGYPPIITVIIIILCALMAGCYFVQRCLPRGTNFFVFSSTRENNLIMSPVFKSPLRDEEYYDYQNRKSINSVEWSQSSSSSESNEDEEVDLSKLDEQSKKMKEKGLGSLLPQRPSQIRMMSKIISQRLRSVIGVTMSNKREKDGPV